MKFAAFTKHDVGVLYMKFLSDWRTLPNMVQFYIELIFKAFMTFSRCSLIYQVYALTLNI